MDINLIYILYVFAFFQFLFSWRIFYKQKEMKRWIYRLVVVIRRIQKEIDELKKLINSMNTAVEVWFFAEVGGKKERVFKMNLQITQQLPLSVAFKDKMGNDAKVDGLPVWSLSAPELGSLEVAADGLSAMFKPAGGVGTLKVQLAADADLGEGVKNILGELEIVLFPAEAVSVVISAGEPQDLPA